MLTNETEREKLFMTWTKYSRYQKVTHYKKTDLQWKFMNTCIKRCKLYHLIQTKWPNCILTWKILRVTGYASDICGLKDTKGTV